MLFRPYLHRATHKLYIDGAVVRNNPVSLANSEAKRIWNSTKPPDIIVSVGTGIQVDINGRVVTREREYASKMKKLLPPGVRTKLELGLDMINATLDCHREWVDFKSTLNSNLNRNSHRIDVGLGGKPPSLDDVESLDALKRESEEYLLPGFNTVRYFDQQYSSANKHIMAVARRLVACLFFLPYRLPNDIAPPGRYQLIIHCRLNPQSEGARQLLALDPQFRLREISSNGPDIIGGIRHVGPVGFDRLSLSSQVLLDVSAGKYERLIEVRFTSRGPDWEVWEPIGGF